MTRRAFETAMEFAKEKGTSWEIVTDIAVGKGINGVSYKTFHNDLEWDEGEHYEYCNVDWEDVVIIDVDRNDGHGNTSGLFREFVGYENIVEVKIRY